MSNLNPRQFPSVEQLAQRMEDHETKPGFYRSEYENSWGPGRSDSNYEYHVPDAEDPNSRVHLAMNVQHRRPHVDYSYDAVEKYHDPNPAGANHIAKRSWVPAAERDALSAHAAGESKLFGSSYTPGRSEVYALFGTKRGASHTGTMLGIAARDTAIKYGRTLTPPDDLSPHSSKLVKNLKGKGVVEETAPDAVTNDYEHYEEPEYTTLNDGHRIPDDEVRAGRSTMRSVLRAGRPRKQRETYTQERLL